MTREKLKLVDSHTPPQIIQPRVPTLVIVNLSFRSFSFDSQKRIPKTVLRSYNKLILIIFVIILKVLNVFRSVNKLKKTSKTRLVSCNLFSLAPPTIIRHIKRLVWEKKNKNVCVLISSADFNIHASELFCMFATRTIPRPLTRSFHRFHSGLLD